MAHTGTAVGVEVILLEMKTAVEKLRESMDQIQLEIDDSLGHLERSLLLPTKKYSTLLTAR